jgi:hypothetical protein
MKMKTSRIFLCLFLAIILIFVNLPAKTGKESKPGFRELECVNTLPSENEDIYFKSHAQIDVDDQGYVYAYDPNNHHFIYKIDLKGELVLKIGRKGRGPGDIFRPQQMRIRQNKLFIIDQFGLSIFDLNGNFLQRFRLFKPVISFDVHDDKIFMVEANNQHLFTVYRFDGKKIDSFGKRYDFAYSLFKRHRKVFVDEIGHSGKVFCSDDDYVFYVADIFGEVHQYDYTGKFIAKFKLEGLSQDAIDKHNELFFKKGIKDASNLTTQLLFIDISYADRKFYMLVPERPIYDEIIEFDTSTLTISSRFRFYNLTDSFKKIYFSSIHLVVKVQGKNKSKRYFISMLSGGDRDTLIKIYK